MRKMLGNAVVKRALAAAMSTMLILASPVIPATAAEEPVVVEFNEISSANGLDKDTIVNQIDEALKDTSLTDEQKDLLKDLGGDLSQLDTTKEAYDVVDDAKVIVNEDVTNAVNKETSDAANAATGAEAIVKDATDKYDEANSQIKQGETSTDTLLKKDQDIVKDVAGNTVISTDADGNETKLVNTIDENGKIILNVEGSDNNKVSLKEYTTDKANTAKDAAATVANVVNNMSGISNSATSVNEAKQTINDAIDAATAARDDAKTACDAANSVLTDEMKRYNAYAKFYGLDKNQYSFMADATVPEFTEEEYKAFLAAEGLTMNEKDVAAGLDAVNNAEIQNSLANQAAEIEAAKTLVDSCNAEIDEANGAIEQIVNAEQTLVNGIQNVIDRATEELKTATGFRKTLLEATIEGAQATLDAYNKEDMGQTVHPTESDPNATNADTFKNRFDYTISQAKDLSNSLDQMVDQATENLNDSQTRYNTALAQYQKILSQYESLKDNAISSNLNALELKLQNAKNDLSYALNDLKDAQEAVDTATNLQKQFNDSINDSNNNNNNDNADNTNNSNSAASNTTTSTSAVATVAISDGATPLASNVTDANGSTDTITINDEGTALIDSVPKTGDSSASAMPFAFGAFAAFAGAFASYAKKKKEN